jgi:hypothetical protein
MIAGMRNLVWSPLGLATMALVVGVLAVTLSNRVRRGLWRMTAVVTRPGWFEPRGRIARALAVVERETSLGPLLRALPPAIREAAAVEPVTVFAIDPGRGTYEPVASSLPHVSAQPIAADDPLPALLRRRRSVLILGGRPDDLEHASIHAVNGNVIRACRALCVVPLRRKKQLIGFILCGGTSGRNRIRLASLARLERVGRRLSKSVERTSRRASGLPYERDEVAGSGLIEHDTRHRGGLAG